MREQRLEQGRRDVRSEQDRDDRHHGPRAPPSDRDPQRHCAEKHVLVRVAQRRDEARDGVDVRTLVKSAEPLQRAYVSVLDKANVERGKPRQEQKPHPGTRAEQVQHATSRHAPEGTALPKRQLCLT